LSQLVAPTNDLMVVPSIQRSVGMTPLGKIKIAM